MVGMYCGPGPLKGVGKPHDDSGAVSRHGTGCAHTTLHPGREKFKVRSHGRSTIHEPVEEKPLEATIEPGTAHRGKAGLSGRNSVKEGYPGKCGFYVQAREEWAAPGAPRQGWDPIIPVLGRPHQHLGL